MCVWFETRPDWINNGVIVAYKVYITCAVGHIHSKLIRMMMHSYQRVCSLYSKNPKFGTCPQWINDEDAFVIVRMWPV